MFHPVSGVGSPGYSTFSQREDIERDPGWRGNISLKEITSLLDQQKPCTYVISRMDQDNFLLSFVREEDQVIMHVQFDKTEDDQWHYKNGADNVDPSLQQIIRKMMHLSESSFEPIPLS